MDLGGSASETKWGSTSYSTLMARSASSAVPSSTAATPTISSPAQKISVPGPWMTSTAYSRHLLGGASVDGGDLGMRVRAAQDFARQQSLGVVVVGIFGSAGRLGWAIDARDAFAQEGPGCRIGPTVLAHDCLPPACASTTARIPS